MPSMQKINIHYIHMQAPLIVGEFPGSMGFNAQSPGEANNLKGGGGDFVQYYPNYLKQPGQLL